MANESSGRIFAIQRYCVNDGPGIRTTVFMQGCPLHCRWCHNPESHSFAPFVSWRQQSCLACGMCKKLVPGRMCRLCPERECSACGKCVKDCPGGALVLQGREVEASEVMQIIRRDIFYYNASGGGITLSGGEPCAQPDFAQALLAAAKAENIRTAIETSGVANLRDIAVLAEKCDLWLFDIKAAPEKYFELTGGDYVSIRRNLQYLSDRNAAIWLRVPLVCGGNVEPALLAELKKLVHLPGVEKVELLPYHDLGRGKYAMCGETEINWGQFSVPEPELLHRWQRELSID